MTARFRRSIPDVMPRIAPIRPSLALRVSARGRLCALAALLLALALPAAGAPLTLLTEENPPFNYAEGGKLTDADKQSILKGFDAGVLGGPQRD